MLDDREWRIIQALQDFQHTVSALAFFSEIPAATTQIERRRFRCFHDSAVISYCRPFTDSKGLPKLSLKSLGIKPTLEESALHTRMMEYRNKVVAHTDADRIRLLVTSSTAFEGEKYAIPHVIEDEGFEFLDDLESLDAWLYRVMTALATFVFDKIQEFPHGIRIVRDHLEDQRPD